MLLTANASMLTQPHDPTCPAVLVTSTTAPPTGLGFAGGNQQNASMLMIQSGVDMFMKVGWARTVRAAFRPGRGPACVQTGQGLGSANQQGEASLKVAFNMKPNAAASVVHCFSWTASQFINAIQVVIC